MDCVTRRGKVYCAVISVPSDLQIPLGRKQIWRSLKTKNYSIAKSQARKLLLAADQLFMQLRTKMDSTLTNAIVAEFGLDLLKFHDEIRLGTANAPSHCDKERASLVEDVKRIHKPLKIRISSSIKRLPNIRAISLCWLFCSL